MSIESEGEWLVIREDMEMTTLQKMAEVCYCQVNGKQFTVERAVPQLGRSQCLGEK